MKEEKFFLVNEFLVKERKELENIIDLVNAGTTKHLERAAFLRNFTNLMFHAHRNSRINHMKKEGQEKQKLKEELFKRKVELLKKLEEHKRMQEKKPAFAVPAKLSEIKDLIISKETGRPFVTTEFSDGVYTVNEPRLKPEYTKILAELKKSNIEEKEQLRNKIKELCAKNRTQYSDKDYDLLRYYLIRDKKKFGRITPMIEDPGITEIVCRGPNKFLTVNFKGKEDTATNIVFDSSDQIDTFLKNIAAKAGEQISPEKPFLNAVVGSMGVNGNISTQFLKPRFVIIKQSL